MKKRNSKLIIAKHNAAWTKVCFILYFLLYMCFNTLINAQSILIWPIEISFNYEAGHSNDALTIRKNNSTEITAPEYLKEGGMVVKNENCCYIKNQTNRKIKVKFYSNTSNMNFLVKATVISGEGLGNVCESFVGACDVNTNEVTFCLSDAMSGSIGKRTFTWKWEAKALTINYPYCPITCQTVNTEHTFYTLIAAPQAPMAVPWTDVLDFACVWANGQSSIPTTTQKIVEGLYDNTDFLYDTQWGFPRYTGDENQPFNLSRMLSEIGGTNIIVNCYDMGKSVNIFANALGCGTTYLFIETFGYVNCIIPIGREWTNNPAYDNPNFSSEPIVGEDYSSSNGRSPFTNHGLCRIDSIYYDACFKVDTDSNPDAPPFENGDEWATGWDWTTYKGKVIDDIPYVNTSTPNPCTSYSVY